MNKSFMVKRVRVFSQCFVFICLLNASVLSFATPLFDVHLHYNQADVDSIHPVDVVSILKRNKVRHAMVTSRPPELVMKLYRQAPDLIIPMLGVYQTHDDKARWFNEEHLPERLEAELKKGNWRAMGELHIFAEHRYTPVFKKIIQLAVKYGLPLSLHADPAVIDAVYELAPAHPVIWAHAGTFPYPDLLADYLRRYPQLHIDMSVRDERIAPGGKLSDDWYELFVKFPARFMVGVDTYSTSRWKRFNQVVGRIRNWLSQLPPDIAYKISFANADRVLHGSSAEY